MNGSTTDSPADSKMDASTRWLIYTLLIAAALGQTAGKILAVNSVDLTRVETRRLEAAVQRERQRLADAGAEGEELETRLAAKRDELHARLRLQRPFLSSNDRSRWMAIRAIAENGNHEIDPFLEEPTWDSIDMVQHPGRDGQPHQYSSKPPLLMVLLAGPYWVLMQLTGTTLGESPYLLGRTMLILFNGGALVWMLVSIARLVERFGLGDLDRLFAMTVAAFGTQLAAFTPVLNNHLFAAAATAAACEAWTRLLRDDRTSGTTAAFTGLTAAFAATCELPALSLVVLIGLSLLAGKHFNALAHYTGAVALTAIAFFGTTYWAHDSLRPPYAHRSETDPADNWYDYEFTVNGQTRDSYWRNRRGIDVGEASRATYALHTLIGHHGVFSLTPVWLLSLIGGAALLGSRDASTRQIAWLTLAITAACLVFYIGLRPQGDRNYGGSTNGFRWLFWLAPLWITMLLPAVDRFKSSRLGMGGATALLALSVMSASYPTWNPWTAPWVYQWLKHLGFTVLGS